MRNIEGNQEVTLVLTQRHQDIGEPTMVIARPAFAGEIYEANAVSFG